MEARLAGKHLFFDYDGTLSVEGIFPQEHAQALNRAKEAGAKLILNTGRAAGNYEKNVNGSCAVEWDAKIYGMSDIRIGKKMRVRHKMTFAQLYPWYRYAIRNRNVLILEGSRKDYPIRFHRYEKGVPAGKKFLSFFELLIGKQISYTTKLTLLGEINRNDLPKSDLQIVQQPGYFEILPKGRDKGTAILEYCKLTGVNPKDCICFGDSENDLGMFRVCGLGICMRDSKPGLIEVAAYHAKGKYGVAEGIDWLLQKGD